MLVYFSFSYQIIDDDSLSDRSLLPPTRHAGEETL